MPANLFPTDPDENAASLANLGEIMFGCLNAIGARDVVEVGAFHGKSTEQMLLWAERNGAQIRAIDPEPQPDLRRIVAEHKEFELIEATSHEVLGDLEKPDAVIIDGDHNYFTLSVELRLLAGRFEGADLPLLMLHDIGWPLARRDAYYVPERIPPEHRQPLARDTFIAPGEPGTLEEGMPFACVAAHEGGPRNGILTAVEDFLEDHAGLRFARVPAFFGFGVIWHPDAEWAPALADAIEPWDQNPVLERLEQNRILHMVERYRMTRRLERALDAAERSDEVLRALAGSRALGVAEQLSRVHGRGRPAFTRDAVRRALEDDG